jgi:hypothetical protein
MGRFAFQTLGSFQLAAPKLRDGSFPVDKTSKIHRTKCEAAFIQGVMSSSIAAIQGK